MEHQLLNIQLPLFLFPPLEESQQEGGIAGGGERHALKCFRTVLAENKYAI